MLKSPAHSQGCALWVSLSAAADGGRPGKTRQGRNDQSSIVSHNFHLRVLANSHNLSFCHVCTRFDHSTEQRCNLKMILAYENRLSGSADAACVGRTIRASFDALGKPLSCSTTISRFRPPNFPCSSRPISPRSRRRHRVLRRQGLPSFLERKLSYDCDIFMGVSDTRNRVSNGAKQKVGETSTRALSF